LETEEAAARERAETIRFANEQVLRDLLPIVDNLDGPSSTPAAAATAAAHRGVGLILKSLLDVLDRHGVTRIAAKGTPSTDAARGDGPVESEAHSERRLEEHQPGYRLNERLLRPALVSVAQTRENLARTSSVIKRPEGESRDGQGNRNRPGDHELVRRHHGGGRPAVLTNAREPHHASVVAFTESGERLVDRSPRQAITNPENTCSRSSASSVAGSTTRRSRRR